MGINVREKSIEEISRKLSAISTGLNKIVYLESALRETGFTFEIKRFLWGELAKLYSEKKMYEKAAKAMSNKAGIEITFRDKIDSYIGAAEYFSKAGRVDDAEEMFIRATREASTEQKIKIELAKKNIYLVCAKELESKGKKASAIKFYEKLIKTNIEEIEKNQIKNKLISTYKALGFFREAKLLEGI
jgi:tetratricopeptide (TPR) repeat protein